MQRRNPAENAGIRRLRVRISKKVVRACPARCYRGRSQERKDNLLRLLELLSLLSQPRQFLARIRKDLFVFLNHFLEMFSLIGGRLT